MKTFISGSSEVTYSCRDPRGETTLHRPPKIKSFKKTAGEKKNCFIIMVLSIYPISILHIDARCLFRSYIRYQCMMLLRIYKESTKKNLADYFTSGDVSCLWLVCIGIRFIRLVLQNTPLNILYNCCNWP